MYRTFHMHQYMIMNKNNFRLCTSPSKSFLHLMFDYGVLWIIEEKKKKESKRKFIIKISELTTYHTYS